MTVTAGAPLFRINGLSTVWVNAEVPEAHAALVRAGNGVEARSAALPGRTFKGKVSALLPEVNPTTRTIKARIELANPGAQLVPGMRRIAAPMVGGMITAPILSMIVIPAAYLLLQRARRRSFVASALPA